MHQKMIVLDPGHGGPDPGALSREGALEKEVVLNISRKLAEYLRSVGFRIVLTRTEDTDLSGLPDDAPLRERKRADLKNRVEIINESGADAAISIHANAVASSRWSGAQVFYRADRAPENKLLANHIQRELVHITGETKRDINRSVNQYLLQHVQLPAVTVEVGFLSNPREARLLKDPAYQGKVAWAVTVGILRYFAALRRQSPRAKPE